MGEAAYTKYERGESKITIDLLQKVAEFHNVDPLSILSASSPTIIENINNSSIQSQLNTTFQTTGTEQSQMMLKLMESVLILSERIATFFENKKL